MATSDSSAEEMADVSEIARRRLVPMSTLPYISKQQRNNPARWTAPEMNLQLPRDDSHDDTPLKAFIRIHSEELKEDCNVDRNKYKLNKRCGETEVKAEMHREEENSTEELASILSSKAGTIERDDFFQNLLSEQEKLPTVSILDLAGQLAYYACHQIYVTPNAFFILVLDMTKRFEDIVSKEKDNEEGSVFSKWTYRDYLKHWINSIKTFGGTTAPLFLIATHTETKSTDDFKNFTRDFWESVPDEDRDWISKSLKDPESGEYREYPVGLVEFNNNSKRKLESMKMSIAKLFQNESNTKIELPSSWAIMEQVLKAEESKVLSLDAIKKINLSIPLDFRMKSNGEISDFLKSLHDNGHFIYFEDEKLRENAVLDIQWFAKASSKIIIEEDHINDDCKKRLIKEWKSFHKTGELKDKLIKALWEDEPSFLNHKPEILSYMEKLQMIVPLNSFGTTQEETWYVPCMNKKQFEPDFCEEKWNCSSILCFRFTSFAMFIFYRLVAYCISSLGWSVSKDDDKEKSLCLYQTAAVFDHKAHTVVVGIHNDDIQVQVLRIKSLAVDKEVSIDIGKSIKKSLKKLIKTFTEKKTFQRGFKCENIICAERDASFNLDSKLSSQCTCPPKKKHALDVQKIRTFWKKRNATVSSVPTASQPNLDGRTRFAKLGMATNDVLNQAYRDIVELEVPPSICYTKVQSLPTKLQLYPHQERLLQDAQHSGYKNFDISLLYKIIRNVCSNIPKPTKGRWGQNKMPAPGETTVGDDIERIRLIRNSLTGHVSSASTSQTEFDDTWSLMASICQRLEGFTKKKYMDKLIFIQNLILKEKDEDDIIEKLKKEHDRETLETIKSDVQEIKTLLKS